MLKKKYKKAYLVFLFVAVGAFAAAASGQEQPEKVYQLIVRFGVSFAGVSAAQIDALYDKVSQIVMKKTGIKIEFVTAEDSDEIIERLKSGEVQMASLESQVYIDAIESNVPIRPVLNFTIKKKQYTPICIFVRKDSPEAEGLESLRGKRLTLYGSWDWAYLQKYLVDNGIEENVTDYFSKVLFGTNAQSELYSLVFKKADVMVASESSFIMESRLDKRFKKIMKLECMGDYPNGPTVVRTDVDEEDVETLSKMLLNAHKDKDFKEFHMYFIAGEGHFTRVNAEYYEPFQERIAAAREAGWFEDYEKWKEQQQE